MDDLEKAEAEYRAAATRRSEAWRVAREKLGYPESDTPEYGEHHRNLAIRYSELEDGQEVTLTAVPGVHSTDDFAPRRWTVGANDGRGMLMLISGMTVTTIDYANAWPYGAGPTLRELDVPERGSSRDE